MEKQHIALVTGGASGIGNAITKALIEKDIHVVVIDQTPYDPNVFLGIEDQMTYYQTDLKDLASLARCLDEIIKKHQPLKYVINNAAIQYKEPFETMNFDHFDDVIQTNLRAPLFIIQTVKDHMPLNAHIINISSVHGDIPRTDRYAYDASKAGLNLMTKELALALAKDQISVNAIACGAPNTPMNHQFNDDTDLLNAELKTATGRVAYPEEIAEYVLSMCLNSSHMTGQILTVDNEHNVHH